MGPHRKANRSSPLVGQLEGLPHVESQHPKPAGQVLERPDDRVLYLDRGPLAEFIMTEVRLQGAGNVRRESAVGLLCLILGSQTVLTCGAGGRRPGGFLRARRFPPQPPPPSSPPETTLSRPRTAQTR